MRIHSHIHIFMLCALSIHDCTAFVTSMSAQGNTFKPRVAVVTGASRGIGRGIALELGVQGMTVYVTGRSSTASSTTDSNVGGSITETANDITAAGGCGIAVAVDHNKDDQVKALFERIQAEQGRLDLLVNNAFQLNSIETKGSFWEQGAASWDSIHAVGLRSHYIASCYAAPLMIQTAKQGPPPLIVNVSSFGGLAYTFNVAYGVGKCAVDRLARDMSIELEDHGVAVVSVWPGLVRTERSQHLIDTGEWEGKTGMSTNNMESPRFTGRAVVALCNDQKLMDITGKVVVVAEAAKKYGFTDIDGTVPPSIRSLKFMLPTYALPKMMGREKAAGAQKWVPDWLIFKVFIVRLGSHT